MEHWEFLRDGMRVWYWRYNDESGSHMVSPSTFRTLAECIDHAQANGYVPAARSKETPREAS